VTVVAAPDSTAVRVALWRALHVEADAPPHVFEDMIGAEIAAPDGDWRARPDMDPEWTRGFRAWIVARARFVEDLVLDRAAAGVAQYVLLGAGLDTFAQRHPSRLQVFEVDQPGPQEWKRARLVEVGLGVPESLHLVPVDFQAEDEWVDKLIAAGFDAQAPAVVASSGVSMYLTDDANRETLARVARFAPGTTLAMTVQLPTELVDPADRPGRDMALRGAQASGTPFISFYAPEEIVALASRAGFRAARHVAGPSIGERYFSGRGDRLRPSTGEDFLIATT
jgi:methyltransferase (TIGR00027 family)